MNDREFMDYVRSKIFSPLVVGGTHFVLDDVIGPLADISCVVCGHGFHWDFECGETFCDADGDPAAICGCPSKVGLQPA